MSNEAYNEMHALMFDRFGGPEVLEWRQTQDPAVTTGDALVRIEAAGLNFADVYRRTGVWRPTGEPPWINGYEGAGTIEALGGAAGAAGFKVGDRVGFADSPKANAELIAVPVDKLIRLPSTISTETAAAALLQGLTAHYLVRDSHPLKSGEWAVVHAAAGGVGLLLVQIAKKVGARVIGLASSETKREAARTAGADHVIGYDGWTEAVRTISGGGAHVVFDSIGSTLEQSLQALRTGGHTVYFGMAGGQPPPVDANMLMERSLSLTGGDLWNVLTSAQERHRRADELFSWIGDESVKVTIAASIPMAGGAEAHRLLEARSAIGKILLTVPR